MSEPERIAEQDILRLVGNGNRLERPTPSAPSKEFLKLASDEGAFAEFKAHAYMLWIRRMQERGDEIPDNVLATFVKECLRIDWAQQTAAPDTPRQQAARKLEVVRGGGLPPERQAALLAQAFVATGDQAHRDALIELVGVDQANEKISEAGGE